MKKEVTADLKSDFTAVVKDEYGVHILKCKIVDKHKLYFQMFNKTKNILFPCVEINADFGLLKYVKPNKIQKMIESKLCSTESINRNRLIGFYNHFKLQSLIGKI